MYQMSFEPIKRAIWDNFQSENPLATSNILPRRQMVKIPIRAHNSSRMACLQLRQAKTSFVVFGIDTRNKRKTSLMGWRQSMIA